MLSNLPLLLQILVSLLLSTDISGLGPDLGIVVLGGRQEQFLVAQLVHELDLLVVFVFLAFNPVVTHDLVDFTAVTKD